MALNNHEVVVIREAGEKLADAAAELSSKLGAIEELPDGLDDLIGERLETAARALAHCAALAELAAG